MFAKEDIIYSCVTIVSIYLFVYAHMCTHYVHKYMYILSVRCAFVCVG